MTCRGSGVGRSHSRGSSGSLGGQQQLQQSEAVNNEDEMQIEFEATIIEAMPQPAAGQVAQRSDRQQSTMIVN